MKDLKKTDINNLKFIHELEVHQIEIEMQNSQLQKSNDDLIISETKYRRLFESAQDGILILDAESGLITDVNPYLIEMLGYSKEEFIKKTLWEIGFFKDIGSNEEKFLELRRKEYIRYEDMPLETFDGKKKYVEFVSNVYTVGSQKVIQCNIRDITDRKILEKSISDSNQNYEIFFNTVDEFLFVLDFHGNIIHINNTVINKLGYTKEDLIGKSVLILHPENRRKEASIIVNRMLNKLVDSCSLPIVNKNGLEIPAETRITIGKWNGERAIFGVSKDISQLKLSEEKFSKVFYLNPSACGLSNLNTHEYIEVNNNFYKLLKFNRDEVIGKTALELQILSQDKIEEINKKADKDGKIISIESTLRAKDGEIKVVLLSAENIKIQNKEYRFTVVHDITERKNFEQELIKAKEKAEKSDKLKMTFLSNMSHDLRTPINSIIGFSEMLKDDNIKKSEKMNYLNIIIENGDILTNSINDIVDITKIDSDSLKVQKTEIDLNKLLQEIKTQYTSLIKNKVKLNIDIDLNTNIFILSDKYRLKQILTNLMNNAIKFTKTGIIKFGYIIIEKNKLRIYVKDTGIGISKEDFKMIFQRFAQVGQPGSKINKGTGLGLAISKSLCEILNFSELKVESELNKGSVFYFDIPFIIKNQNYIYPNEEKNNDVINLENINILIVEDDINFQMILKSYLKSTKCKISIDNGSEALDIIKKEKINIVLLDLGLGNIDGYEILKKIKEYDPNIIIIVQSAYAIVEFKKKAFDLGANDFLIKANFTADEITEKIKGQLKLK